MVKYSFIILILLCSIFCIGESHAQISSPAFDPNCYQPRLGVPSEIDSIYGNQDQQNLGEYMYGFPPSKDFPAGKVGIGNLPDNPLFLSFVQEGSSFDLHHLQAKAKKSNLPVRFGSYGYTFGHFHNMQHEDILINESGSRIYWADDNGEYDSSKYTDLNSSVIGVFGNDNNPAGYAAFLTSDSIYDVIKIVRVNDTPYVSKTKVLLMLYQGGQQLYDKGKGAYEDSGYLFAGFDKAIQFEQTRFLQGDFRGIGREDLITSDDSGNWFFYKNDPPFSMAKFADALYNDTLLSVWENQPEKNNFSSNPITRALADQVLPHLISDRSMDIVLPVQNKLGGFGINNVQLVIRGGQNFGQSRIYFSQAEQVLHNPWYYDNSFFAAALDGTLTDCGDMTGTGNKVLLGRSGPPGETFNFFYVTGKAINDKIDMYYSYTTQGSVGSVVPLDADGDNYGDVLISDDAYTTQNDVDKDKSDVGTIHLVHGSNKIPVLLNPKYSVEERNAVDRAEWHITAIPNPCDEKTVLTFDNCTTSRMRIQVYSTDGKLVQEEETPAVDGLQQYALYLPTLSDGMYIVRLSCPALGWTGSVNVVKTGSVKGYGNGDLKKMIGR